MTSSPHPSTPPPGVGRRTPTRPGPGTRTANPAGRSSSIPTARVRTVGTSRPAQASPAARRPRAGSAPANPATTALTSPVAGTCIGWPSGVVGMSDVDLAPTDDIWIPEWRRGRGVGVVHLDPGCQHLKSAKGIRKVNRRRFPHTDICKRCSGEADSPKPHNPRNHASNAGDTCGTCGGSLTAEDHTGCVCDFLEAIHAVPRDAEFCPTAGYPEPVGEEPHA